MLQTTRVIITRPDEAPVTNPIEFRAQIIEDLNEHLDNQLISSNLEKGIFNYSIQTATKTNQEKKWNNPEFVRIYLDKYRAIYLNFNTHNIGPLVVELVLAHRVAFETDEYFWGTIDYNVNSNNINNYNNSYNQTYNNIPSVELQEENYDYVKC